MLAGLVQTMLVIGLLAAAVDPAARLWQTPASWRDLITLTDLGAAFAASLYLGATAWSLFRFRQSLSHFAAGCLLLVPFLFGLLLLLAASPLVEALGRYATPGIALSPKLAQLLGRSLVLLLFNETVLLITGFLMDRRGLRAWRLHLLLLGGSVFAAMTPLIADLAALATVTALPAWLRVAVVVLTAAIAQAGLWAQTYFVTGVLLDAIRGRRPTWLAGIQHWQSGLAKGAIYGGVFMLIIQGMALMLRMQALSAWLQAHPVLGSLVGGVLLFPLAKTLVESFDGSAPFFTRLLGSTQQPINYLRGAIAGAGLGLALAYALPQLGSGLRFGAGFLVGALAYGGADLLWDTGNILRRRRQRLQSWRVYFLGAVLGGIVAGALAWYCDAAQVHAVSQKFLQYAAASYAAAALPGMDYVVYPLFSKWGAIDLGHVEGSVRLFYNESLSGVINWSLAAPLFSINLVVLTALFRRSLKPLQELFSATGFATLVEQTVRVLRWGLWMAPIIYSFLRLAPDPNWYNQDGAVRSAVATLKSWTLSPADFRAWSLEVFLALLAYDWLRMLIWFDHMGLRVATLVNLSFVGGDALDEKAARFLGHSARTRCIPEGIRRFLTWAPLLIPFYIPRGADWDHVWTQSQALHDAAAPMLPAVVALMAGYRIAALGFTAIVLGLVIGPLVQWRRNKAAARPARRERPFTLSNGQYSLELWPDGRGYSRVTSTVRKGYELDITRRPDDPLQLRGKFFYFRALGEAPGSEPWSLTAQPCRITGADYRIEQAAPDTLRITNSHNGLRAEAGISIDAVEPVETWRLRLVNLESRRRRVEITSFQELALSGVEAYRRSPPFSAIHVGTWFVKPLGAVLCRNRLLRDARKGLKHQRMSHEVSFHAARTDAHIRLTGYEDSRAHFIGASTPRSPAALHDHGLRDPDDDGLLYGFDPAASLRLQVELPPNGMVELRFVDGYAENETVAADRIARHLGIRAPEPLALQAALGRRRQNHEVEQPGVDALPFEFSADGKELRLMHPIARPWCHLMANPLGHGAIASSDGEIFSFAANSQQNALSPFNLDTIPAQLPGQAFYVVELGSGKLDTPTETPCRRQDASSETIFGRGYVTYRKSSGSLGMELTAFTLPDKPAELRLLRLRNQGPEALRLRVTPYVEIVLAEVHADSRDWLQARQGSTRNALFFCNPHNDFHKGEAFVATSLTTEANETRRSRFMGARRDPARPYFATNGHADAAQPDDGHRIAGFTGTLELPAGGEAIVTLVMGQTQDPAEAAELIQRYTQPAAVEAALMATQRWWGEQCSVLRIETNLPEFDRLVNDWLPYQLMTSRLWGRTGPSQRSGAFGFRDQLQDVLPLVFLQPELARKQILLHAGQQFLEGDVLKWWHLSWEGRTGIGVRTRASDPQLWLPYVTCRYVEATGDHAILDEVIPFIEGHPVPQGAEGYLFAPRTSRDTGTLYEHCRRAIDLSLSSLGAHGIPLLGSGDWNDGLDALGLHGRGESLWLGFFLHDVLMRFAGVAGQREGAAVEQRYRDTAARLRDAVKPFWRGDRYVRATSDDGEELRATSALMAAWPLLSGAADLEHGLTALESALREIEKDDRVLLGTPPFTENSLPYPGRLADYPPGARENGGQYSHGVSWTVDAYLRAAALAAREGNTGLAARCRARAVELWIKISPLSKVTREKLRLYGLPPHQQPADVYDGPGCAGRGGWSWYTGAAARMLSAAYAILGLRMENGELRLPDDLFAPKGSLQLRRLTYRGKTFQSPDR